MIYIIICIALFLDFDFIELTIIHLVATVTDCKIHTGWYKNHCF